MFVLQASVSWWIQNVGGFLSILVSLGIIIGALYSFLRGAPKFVRKAVGLEGIQTVLGQLREDHKTTQTIMIAQAESFNDLSKTVCEEHNIPPDRRPARMDVNQMRTELSKRETLPDDFTRGGDD